MLESLDWLFLAKVAGTAWAAWALTSVIYNVYFHPLSKVPGPKLYAASKLPWLSVWISGEAGHFLDKLHKKYGPAVRYSPHEVSFITSQAWADIYDHEKHRIFLKDRRMYMDPPGAEPSIVSTPDYTNHARQRRLVSHAFSDKAVREQEPIMKMYVDLLISKLKGATGKPINIVEWYNWTTFDMVGDLAYGEPFGCLENTGYHEWVTMIFESMAGASFMAACNHLYPLNKILMSLIPKKLMDSLKWRDELGREKLERRKRMETSRKDFFAYILRQDGRLKMSDSEMENNSITFIIAGSETTATLLSGATYLLLKNPDCMAKVVDEIRSTFKDESEIDLAACGNLKYLAAVFSESGRLYPPVPLGLARTACEDAIVDGYLIPKGCNACVTQFPAYRSSLNFTEPEEFIPERWLELRDEDDRRVVQPFSIGPRNCVGKNLAYAEMRLILTRVLWNYDFTLVEDKFGVDQQKIFFLWEKPALNVIIERRKD